MLSIYILWLLRLRRLIGKKEARPSKHDSFTNLPRLWEYCHRQSFWKWRLFLENGNYWLQIAKMILSLTSNPTLDPAVLWQQKTFHFWRNVPLRHCQGNHKKMGVIISTLSHKKRPFLSKDDCRTDRKVIVFGLVIPLWLSRHKTMLLIII